MYLNRSLRLTGSTWVKPLFARREFLMDRGGDGAVSEALQLLV